MGVREWANNSPNAVSGIVGLCVVGCGVGVIAELVGGRHAMVTTAPQHYFSVDDGATFFAGNGVAPFDYQGKVALRAYVFDCGGHRFVGYLERYKPDARLLELAGKAGPIVENNGKEIKKPGSGSWFDTSDTAGMTKVIAVTCPSGSGDTPTPVEP